MVEVIDDPDLGRLTYDDAGWWYKGRAEVTPGREALLFVLVEPGVTDVPHAVAVARGTLARLRQNDAGLRRAAARELAAQYPEQVSPLTVEQVTAALWVGSVYFSDDGGARVDWDADVPDDVLLDDYPDLLDWSSVNWVSHVDPSGRCTKVAWEGD
jgi:hypothetical protein